MDPKVETHILENGLTILTKELHHVPLVSHWVWYRVGSRNETKGKTGISHWVEHMQFKGTPKYPVNVGYEAISREGGMWNAMTSLDWTAYFETLPSNKVDIAMDMEADRMLNSLFDKEETELERTVVISEREGNENEPLFRLGEAVQHAAFKAHPYRNQVIGDLEDLKTITRDGLYQHYRDHYAPNHALITLAGDFDTSQLLKKISSLYGGIKPRTSGDVIPAPEPILNDPQKIEIEGPGDTIYLQLSYRSPAANSDDFFALTVIDSLLSGPSSLSMMGGGGVSNKTSRLYQALVEKDLAVSISGGVQATIDPYLYELLAILPPEKSTDAALKAVDLEITRLQQEKVSPQELARAVKQAKALFAYGSESITNQAFWLGYASMFADHTWFETYIQRMEQVSPEQILAFAQRWLDPEHRIIGIYQPKDNRK